MQVCFFMIWGGWDGDLGLELYVTDRNCTDPIQYEASQRALHLIQQRGVANRIDIITISDLSSNREEFGVLLQPGTNIKLPFLITGFGCETGAFLGHSGLEEVTLAIERLLPRTKGA